jgi:hypothetical protein
VQQESVLAQLDKLLLSVGAMKSGTTWLYRQLEQHPSTNFSLEKEIHYLAYLAGDRSHLNLAYRASRLATARQRAHDRGTALRLAELAWYLDYLLMPRTWGWYSRRFGAVAPGQYCADFSNLTALLDQASWQALVGRVKDLRLIYILRNPLDRIWSQLKSHYRSTGEQQLLSAMEDYAPDAGVPEQDLVRHSLYADNLRRILDVVPRERVHVALYDQIEEDPLGLLRDIERFLQIPSHTYLPAKLGRRINSSEALPRPAWVARHFYPCVTDDLKALAEFNIKVPASWCA